MSIVSVLFCCQVTAVMAVVCSAVRAAVRSEIPVGVQVNKTL